MTEEAAFLAKIAAQPQDDLVRKAYADFLEERPHETTECLACGGLGEVTDDDGKAWPCYRQCDKGRVSRYNLERAELIRVQLEATKGPPPAAAPDESLGMAFAVISEWERRRRGLEERAAELISAHEWLWLAGSPLLSAGWQANSTWVPDYDWEWRRGFVDEVRGTWTGWYGVCPTCLAGTPAADIDGAPCSQCHDRKPRPHGPDIVKSNPCIRTVSLGDRRPLLQLGQSYRWYGSELGEHWVYPDTLPLDVFRRLTPGLGEKDESPALLYPRRIPAHDYASEALALAAASAALIGWARDYKED